MQSELMDHPELTEEEAVAIAEAAEDLVPSIDQVEGDEPPLASYRDWLPEQTRVIKYSNDLADLERGYRIWPTLAAARSDCEKTFGRILETNAVPGRWFFRVRKA